MKKRLGFSLISSILLVGCEDTTQPELVAPEVSPAFDVVAATPVNTFTVTNTSDVGVGSLRQAILDANASIGFDLIDFNIPGAGPHTIQPLSNLPTITDPVTIDGYTQPGASPNTNGPGLGSNTVLKIELDGSSAGVGASGLTIVGGGSTVKGLVINRFNALGIWLNGNGGSVVRGNFVGTDATGRIDLGNGSHGIFVTNASDNVIGGTAFSARNVVSGNDRDGIRIEGSLATGNKVFGNFIGTDLTGTLDVGNATFGVQVAVNASNTTVGGTHPGARNLISGNFSGVILRSNSSGTGVFGNFIGTDVTGMSALGNTRDGVHVLESFNNTIGGTHPGARNVISGNGDDGIQLSGNATNNVVQGNYIGTAVTGTAGLGNGGPGVVIFGSNNTIGGSHADAGNVISGNGDAGIAIIVLTGVTGSVNRNLVAGNSISSNTGLGIDLGVGIFGTNAGGDGVTPNDLGDGDTGANNLQNFPVLASATSGSGSITIAGDLNSTATAAFRVEFFANTVGDPSGHGEGETFIGATNVTTDASGNASFTVTLSATVPAGQLITATATDPGNNTSEFSAFVTAEPIVPFATFDIEEAEVELDEFEVEGSFAVAAGSGIDVPNEDVIVTFGGFSETIPKGSFFRDDDDQGFQFNGVTGGITRIEIRDDGEFEVEGRGIPELSGIALPSLVPFSLRIGDDIGETDIQFDDEGQFPTE